MSKKTRSRSVGRVKLYRLFFRDNGICHICLTPVNDFITPESITDFRPKKYRTIIPYDASADHIIDHADGGTDNLDNLKLAHKKCNVKRGALNEQRRRERKRLLKAQLTNADSL